MSPRLLTAALTVNDFRPLDVVMRISSLLREEEIGVSGRKILVVGVAYKPDVHDTKNSPALEIIKILSDILADVSYYDDLVPDLSPHGIDLQSAPPTVEELEQFDCVVIVTRHSHVNYDSIMRHAPLVLDMTSKS